jgi:hypothetical protein
VWRKPEKKSADGIEETGPYITCVCVCVGAGQI